MKLKYASMAMLAGVALLCSSCLAPYGYGTLSYSTNGYDSSVAWTSASYDSDGFPIFGYSYGRPVYGYTASGAAIFTIAALTALSYVPHWKPAPWYRGHWGYPAHVHRVAAPPHFPVGHRPASRPHGGLHAPVHHNPGAVFGAPSHGHSHKGFHGPISRPVGSNGHGVAAFNHPARPHNPAHATGPVSRPASGGGASPSMGAPNRGPVSRPAGSGNAPGNFRPHNPGR